MMRARLEDAPTVVIGGVPVPSSAIVSVEAWLAVDRPDRLEIVVAAGELDPDDAAPALPPPGTAIGVALRSRAAGLYPPDVPSRSLFDGLVARHRLEWSPDGGARLRIVAFAAYQRLRGGLRDRVFLHATGSEIACAIASSLELVAVVDRTREVHAVQRVTQDPLRLLRDLARRAGYELALADGRLYFVAQLPGTETLRLRGPRDVLEASLAAQRGGDGSRGGWLSVAGDPACRPLRSVVVSGVAGGVDGIYRIARALHHWEPGRYRARLDVLEFGLDVEAWRRPGSTSSIELCSGRDAHAF